ncbi:hypothetical protein SAMD00019534_025690 [Acytostelium subglobosum LB1]|uniref:hypothetical protein n=1 Tax=Acytostelium subglobosum LB1 TaxID=1410327 RepID=UPI000645057E|nr:hypothetical protein SAMD00019534_025690 [Acytostelium subglobosum LB1]GAM19394.1 hypothetical protein SAMD00019534_025690 [Acytostelium subglobosum LB1]|eukprot:XP_012757321.1 hypothetical protein SAMD00019534_025690 [Acytostelium subglobosum LB1]
MTTLLCSPIMFWFYVNKTNLVSRLSSKYNDQTYTVLWEDFEVFNADYQLLRQELYRQLNPKDNEIAFNQPPFNNSFVVHRDNFIKYYGRTFAARAAIFSMNERINVNTEPYSNLRVLPGVGDQIAKDIITHRHQKVFANLDDLKSRVTRFPKDSYTMVEF